MIPEAAVEAAAKALYEVYPSLAIPGDESSAVPWESAHPSRQYEDRKQGRAALEAAAPIMLEACWDAAAEAAIERERAYGSAEKAKYDNPYRPAP